MSAVQAQFLGALVDFATRRRDSLSPKSSPKPTLVEVHHDPGCPKQRGGECRCGQAAVGRVL